MRIAIGKPGERVRFFEGDETLAAMQVRTGEVSLETQETGNLMFSSDGKSLQEIPVPLDIIKLNKISDIKKEFSNRIVTGVTWQGEQVSIDDGSRANLGGMALKASNVIAGNGTWPDSLAKGWIANSGFKILLPTPEDGYALADSAMNLYSNLAHYEQDLEDSVNNATTELEITNINITVGWPT